MKSKFMKPEAHDFQLLDLRRWENCLKATEGMHEVYSLAANMGGIGFIETVHGEVMHDNILINTHMIEAARQNGIRRYFYSSSACVYPTFMQEETDCTGLKEDDAYPADPDNEYGWEKLYTERLCAAYRREYGLETRVARFHNIYGPFGTYEGGREKAPAAMCRKAAAATDYGKMEIWGDGRQTRSFCFITDCLEGTHRLMRSDHHEPLNIGSEEMVTINELADIAIELSGKHIDKTYLPDRPQGVRGRNSDNTRMREVLDWEPGVTLWEGMGKTYPWVDTHVRWGRVKPSFQKEKAAGKKKGASYLSIEV